MLKRATVVVTAGLLLVFNASVQARNLAYDTKITGCTPEETSLRTTIKRWVGRNRAGVAVNLTGFFLQNVDGEEDCRGPGMPLFARESQRRVDVGARILDTAYDRDSGFVTFRIVGNLGDSSTIPWDRNKIYYHIGFSIIALD